MNLYAYFKKSQIPWSLSFFFTEGLVNWINSASVAWLIMVVMVGLGNSEMA